MLKLPCRNVSADGLREKLPVLPIRAIFIFKWGDGLHPRVPMLPRVLRPTWELHSLRQRHFLGVHGRVGLHQLPGRASVV